MTDGTDGSCYEEFIVFGNRGQTPLLEQQEAIHAIAIFPEVA
jgi:hypothetical protein